MSSKERSQLVATLGGQLCRLDALTSIMVTAAVHPQPMAVQNPDWLSLLSLVTGLVEEARKTTDSIEEALSSHPCLG